MMDRRHFLALGAGAAASLRAAQDLSSRICIFTDHLGGFDYIDVAKMFRELGVQGPDLTVRRGGLVLPDRVTEDLPRAASVFKDHGLTIPMITTDINSARDPKTRAVLSTAARVGVRYYKLGYFHYADMSKWHDSIVSTNNELRGLAALGKELGIRAALHNHSGDSVGGAMWDGLEAIDGVDPKQVGLFFDPAHGTIEGGKLGWNLGFRRASSRLFMVAIKDFVWEKTEKGWRTRWVPLGQGMVQWPAVMQVLKTMQFEGPISLHIEYDPGGKTKAERYDKALEAAARDLKFLRGLLAT
jgi:L-ribulose-5-phosphate 3-epimerase